MKIPLFLLIVSVRVAIGAEAPPPATELGRASVTLPYSELRALWEAGQRKVEPPPAEPAPAPVPSLVHRSELSLQLSEGEGSLNATFDVEILSKDWQTIALLGGDSRLDQAEAGGRSVIWADGYALLTNQPGKAPVTMHLVTMGSRQLLAGNVWKIKLGRAAVKQLRVEGIPSGMEARVNGQRPRLEKGGGSLFYLPGEAGEVELSLSSDVPKPAPPITLSSWQTESQSLIRLVDGRLAFQSQISARTSEGSGMEITLALPANASAIQLTGEDLADWTQSRNGDGRRLVRVRWKTRDLLDRSLNLSYSLPHSPLAEQWTFHAPVTASENAGENASRHLYAIVPAQGLELRGEGWRNTIQSRRLPEWMQTAVAGAAFVTTEAGPQVSVQTHWLPTMSTAEAIITQAKAQLRLVADGASQTTTTYLIKHEAPLSWTLELPAEVELLSCQVGKSAARPIKRADGVLELVLPTPPKEGLTSVSLVYTAKTRPLDPVSGQVALELPRTPLFIEHLDWSVVIPAAYEVTANEGNVVALDQAPEANQGLRTLAFQKDFCRAERPQVALFYERRSTQN